MVIFAFVEGFSYYFLISLSDSIHWMVEFPSSVESCPVLLPACISIFIICMIVFLFSSRHGSRAGFPLCLFPVADQALSFAIIHSSKKLIYK